VHRTLASLALAFVLVHLAVNLTAVHDLATYNVAAGWFRLVWRTPVTEPLLVAILAGQLVTGLLLVLDASVGRSTFEHLCQLTAGLYIAVFLTSHTLAVGVLGRGLLNRGPAFTFASAGDAGLFGSAQAATLLPYYALGVLAIFVHLARPARLLALRGAGSARSRKTAGVIIAIGAVVSLLLLTALVHPT
jgi:hypothetical protein